MQKFLKIHCQKNISVNVLRRETSSYISQWLQIHGCFHRRWIQFFCQIPDPNIWHLMSGWIQILWDRIFVEVRNKVHQKDFISVHLHTVRKQEVCM